MELERVWKVHPHSMGNLSLLELYGKPLLLKGATGGYCRNEARVFGIETYDRVIMRVYTASFPK